MKTLIVVSLLVLSIHSAYSDEVKCALASTCIASYAGLKASNTCDEKAPLFKCFRDRGCDRSDDTYERFVELYSYEKCGASAIIMGWTLPILMFTLSKYFSK